MTGQAVQHAIRAGLVLTMLAFSAGRAAAQGAAPPRAGRSELSINAMFVGPVSFGRSAANYSRPDGNPFTLFTSKNGVAPGVGAEVHAGFDVTSRLTFEGTVGWTRANLESTVTGDVEGASGVTATQTLVRFSGDGSLLWAFARRGAFSFYARGGAGVMRELADQGILGATGTIGNAGVVMKYWKRTSSGSGSALGLRVEGRASVRLNGIALGAARTVIAPVISGGIMFRF